MKKTLLLIALMLCCAMTMFAQNNKISYQAVVRDTENKLVANKDVTVTVKIFDGDAQQPAYTQTYENVHTNLNGLISLQIGPALPNEAWSGIHWNNARIETTVTLAGTELGMLAMPLTAVPYAFYADNAAHAVLADQAAQLDPNASTITDIYEKMTSDSAAIYVRMHADSVALAGHLNDTLSKYVKKADLCGEVKTCVADDFAAVYDKIHADSLALAGQITNRANNIDTRIDSLRYANDTAQTNIRAEIADSADSLNTKIGNLANSVDSAKTNIRGEIAALGHDVAANYYTKAEIDAQAQQLTNTLNALNARIDSVINVMNNLPTRMAEKRDTVQTAGQTDFTLPHKARTDCVVKLYINGVMVGGNYNEVVTVATSSNQTTVTYDPAKNGNYALKADDKVTIVYWY